LFLYKAAPGAAAPSPRREQIKQLENELFADDEAFRRSLNGCIGGNKSALLEIDEIEARVETVITKFESPYREAGHMVKVRSQICWDWLFMKMEDLC
jgi:hypothetical protein